MVLSKTNALLLLTLLSTSAFAEPEPQHNPPMKPTHGLARRDADKLLDALYARDPEAEAKFPNILAPIKKIFGRDADAEDYLDALYARDPEAEAKFPNILAPIKKIFGRDAGAEARIPPSGVFRPPPLGGAPGSHGSGRPRPRSVNEAVLADFLAARDADPEAEAFFPLIGMAATALKGKGKRDAEADARIPPPAGVVRPPSMGGATGSHGSGRPRPRSVGEAAFEDLFLRDAEARVPLVRPPGSGGSGIPPRPRPRSVDEAAFDDIFARDAEADADPEVWEE